MTELIGISCSMFDFEFVPSHKLYVENCAWARTFSHVHHVPSLTFRIDRLNHRICLICGLLFEAAIQFSFHLITYII